MVSPDRCWVWMSAHLLKLELSPHLIVGFDRFTNSDYAKNANVKKQQQSSQVSKLQKIMQGVKTQFALWILNIDHKRANVVAFKANWVMP